MTEQAVKLEAKLEEWKQDEVFLDKVAAAATPEELSKVFAEKGEDLSVEEAQKVLDLVQNSDNEELDIEDLDNVNGGWAALIAYTIVAIAVAKLYLYIKTRKPKKAK